MKPEVNIIDFLESIIKKANENNRLKDVKKVYELKLVKDTVPLNQIQAINKKKGGAKSNKVPCKKLRLYLHDLETNKRTVLYENTAVYKDPRKAITGEYRITLYKDFLLQCTIFTLSNIEDVLKQQQAKKALEVAEKAAKETFK